jgi:hypothetical protein
MKAVKEEALVCFTSVGLLEANTIFNLPMLAGWPWWQNLDDRLAA